MTTKINVKSIIALAAALISLVLYLITSLTGYLAGSTMNIVPVICTLAAMLLIVLCDTGKLPAVVKDVSIVASGLLLIASLSLYAMARVTLAADVYFIPVNYPVEEATALHMSIAGVVMYLISFGAVTAKAFSAKE